MAWITPKTNWVSTDYFNIGDYARIVGNIKYLKDYLETMYDPVTIATLEDTKTYSSMLYASELNNIENAVENINIGTYNFNIGTKPVYVANGNTPDYNEFNRIESALLKLKNTLQAQYDNLPRLAFTLGNYREIKL